MIRFSKKDKDSRRRILQFYHGFNTAVYCSFALLDPLKFVSERFPTNDIDKTLNLFCMPSSSAYQSIQQKNIFHCFETNRR